MNSPLNYQHPLLRNLSGFWLVKPPTMIGSYLLDQVGISHGLLQNFKTLPNGWSSVTSPGGAGSILFNTAGDTIAQIDCGNASLLQITGPITFACWFNIQGLSVNGNVLCAKYLEDGGTGGYLMEVYNGGATTNLYGFIGYGNSVGGGTPLNSNQWYYGTVVSDGNTIYIYLNGNLDGSGSAATLVDSSTNFLIGSYSAAGLNFIGNIDGVMVWSRALSASEVMDMYHRSQNAYDGLWLKQSRMYSLAFTQWQGQSNLLGQNQTTNQAAINMAATSTNLVQNTETTAGSLTIASAGQLLEQALSYTTPGLLLSPVSQILSQNLAVAGASTLLGSNAAILSQFIQGTVGQSTLGATCASYSNVLQQPVAALSINAAGQFLNNNNFTSQPSLTVGVVGGLLASNFINTVAGMYLSAAAGYLDTSLLTAAVNGAGNAVLMLVASTMAAQAALQMGNSTTMLGALLLNGSPFLFMPTASNLLSGNGLSATPSAAISGSVNYSSGLLFSNSPSLLLGTNSTPAAISAMNNLAALSLTITQSLLLQNTVVTQPSIGLVAASSLLNTNVESAIASMLLSGSTSLYDQALLAASLATGSQSALLTAISLLNAQASVLYGGSVVMGAAGAEVSAAIIMLAAQAQLLERAIIVAVCNQRPIPPPFITNYVYLRMYLNWLQKQNMYVSTVDNLPMNLNASNPSKFYV